LHAQRFAQHALDVARREAHDAVSLHLARIPFMTSRSLSVLVLSVIGSVFVGCADAPNGEATAVSDLETAPAPRASGRRFRCNETSTTGGSTITEEGSVTFDASSNWLTMSRKRTVNGAVTGTGSAQGFAIVASGNLNARFASSLDVTTHLLGDIGLVTAVDGSSPRMLLPGGALVRCTAE